MTKMLVSVMLACGLTACLGQEPSDYEAAGSSTVVSDDDTAQRDILDNNRQPASQASETGDAVILSACRIPPCGDIFNHTDTWWEIRRKDSDSAPWIYSSIGPGQHKGGFSNDGIDWDNYGIPYKCSVNVTVSGSGTHPSGGTVQSNNTINGTKWVKFDSNQTVHLDAYTCRGI